MSFFQQIVFAAPPLVEEIAQAYYHYAFAEIPACPSECDEHLMFLNRVMRRMGGRKMGWPAYGDSPTAENIGLPPNNHTWCTPW